MNRLVDSHVSMYQEKTAQENTISNYKNYDTSIIGLLEKEDYVQQINLIDEEVSIYINNYAQKHNLAPKDILLSIVGILLQKYYYVSDVMFGEMNEIEIQKNTDKRLLDYINPIAVKADQHSTLNSIINEVANRSSKCNGSIRFNEIDKVIDKDTSLIKMLVIEETMPITKCFLSLSQDNLKELKEFEIILLLKEVEKNYTCYVLYNQKRYEDRKIKYFISHLDALFKESIQDFNQKINDLSAVSEEEKQHILYKFSKGNMKLNKKETIISLFENQVRRTPQRVAIVFGNESLTYKQLNDRANMIRNKLLRNDVRLEDSVIILSKHCMEQIIAILGILKAGGAYVPISPDYPVDRINYIIDDCNAKLMLTTDDRQFSEIIIPVLNISGDVYETEAENYDVNVSPKNLAYIIYTSGTTGKPKGIMIEHDGVVNLCNNFTIAGGVRVSLNPIKNSKNNGISSKDEKAKTFDDSSDGTGSGEGVVSIILKPLEKALEDRDNIYAVIKGSAINQDGSSAGITAPNPAAQEEVIVEAWKHANVNPDTISYIEAHGTGTKLGDPIEIAGITGAFRRYTTRKQFCAIGSLKTNVGHLDSLAGVAGLIKAVLALKYGEIPPSLHFNLPNRNIEFENSPVYVCDQLQSWRPKNGLRRCGVSAFGLSGTNCHVVLEEAPRKRIINNEIPGGKYLLTISAKTKESRNQLIQSYCDFLDKNQEISIADMCYTSNIGREHQKYRTAIVAEDMESLYCKIKELCRENWTENHKEDDVYFNLGDGQALDMDSLTAEMTAAVNEYSLGNTEMLNCIAWLYAKGVNVDFDQMYMGSQFFRISLPTYPFQATRCWIDIPEGNRSEVEGPRTYQTRWYEDQVEELEQKAILRNVLIFEDKQGKGKAIAEKLRSCGTHVIEVQVGDTFREIDPQHYEISLEEKSYQSLFESLSKIEFSHIIHTMSINENGITNVSEFDPGYKNGLFSIMYITKYIGGLKKKVAFVIVSNCGNRVTGEEDAVYPMNAMLFGWTKAIYSEYKNIQVSCIDIDLKTLVESIIKEIEFINHEHLIAYRDNKRYITRVEQVDLNQVEEREVHIKENGVYVVTGGRGKAGIRVCNYLASKNKVNIISFNRTLIKIENDDSNSEFIQKIRNSGSEIEFVPTDVTNYHSLNKSLQYIRDKYGHIDGIIHCAAKGVGKAGTKIAEETERNLAGFLGPKVQGTWMIHQLTKTDQLDFMILFSSNITLSGGSSSSAYIAGNTFLDAFPDSVNLQRITTINFPRLQLGEGTVNDQDQLFSTMLMEHAMNLMDKILGRRIARCILGDINLDGQIMQILDRLPFRFGHELEYLLHKRESSSNKNYEEPTRNDVKIHDSGKEVYTKSEKIIAESICKLLELDEIDIQEDFFELGGNSIFAIKLESDLEKYGFVIGADEFYTYNTVKKMAAFVEKNDLHITESVTACLEKPKEVSDAKVIDHIEPFNEIFYKSCFFNSLIPIILHYEKDVTPIIINDICVYKRKNLENSEYILDTHYMTQKNLLDVIRSMGIGVSSKERSESVKSDIMNAIDRRNPVILWVDCYYASIRPDVYEKKHQAHTWLIYGYDAEQKIFHIIEHSIKDNLYYKKKVVSFDELEEAYYGYLSQFQKMNTDVSYYEFEHTKDSQEGFTDYKAIYKSFLMQNKDRIFYGLELLHLFIEDYQRYVLSKEQLDEKIEDLVDSLNNIINAKKIMRYRSEKLYSSQSMIYELISKILKNYQKIRGILVKYQYTRVYHKKYMEDSILILKDIHTMECEHLMALGI